MTNNEASKEEMIKELLLGASSLRLSEIPQNMRSRFVVTPFVPSTTTQTTTTANGTASLYAKSIAAVHEDEMPPLAPMTKVYDEDKDMAVEVPSISYAQALRNSTCFAPLPLVSSSESKEEVVTAATNPFNDTEEYYHKANEAIDNWSAEEWNVWTFDAHLLRPLSNPQDEQARKAVGLPAYGWRCTTCMRTYDYPTTQCTHEWLPCYYNRDDVD